MAKVEVQVPAALEPLFPFVKRAKVKHSNAFFESYAHLVTFAACVGFHRLDGTLAAGGARRTDQIEPIDWEYFGNDRLQTALHLIALVASGGTEAVDDPDQLCRLVEGFAAEGAKELVQLLRRVGDSSFHLELGELLIQTFEQTGKVTI